MDCLPTAGRTFVGAFALLLLVFVGSAAAETPPTPPTPTCFYEVAGACDPVYGTPNSSSTQIVEVDGTVTLGSGFDPAPPFGTPVNTPCGPGSEALCLYSNIAWKIATPTGLSQPPITIQDNTCGSESLICKFTYRPRGIGIDGDYWQTFVAAYQHGSIPLGKRGFAVYARPRFRWVTAQSTGAPGYLAGVAYAVRGGTNPAYGECLDAATINATSATDFDCLRVTGRGSGSQNPSWKFALPSGSGAWDLIIDPIRRTETGPTKAPGQRWQSRTVSVANSDIEATVSHLPEGTLKVAIDTVGSQIQVGTKRRIRLVLTQSGGTATLDRVSWEFDYLVKQLGSSSGIVVEDGTFDGPTGNVTVVPGESVTQTVSVRADSVGSATFVAKAHWRNADFSDHTATSAPATLTAVEDPVPPPPDDEPSGAVPKPPIPTAASAGRVEGRVDDEPLTSYLVTWFAAPSCDATDATSHQIGDRTVTTDAVGLGDASVTPVSSPAGGEAVFGYSTLNGVRSARSECVFAAGSDPGPVVTVATGSAAGNAPPTAPAPPGAKPPKLTVRVPARIRANKRFDLTVAVGPAAAGSVTVRKGKRKLAGPVKVRRGTATIGLKLPAGRRQLTLVFTPAAGGRPITKSLTVGVPRAVPQGGRATLRAER